MRKFESPQKEWKQSAVNWFLESIQRHWCF